MAITTLNQYVAAAKQRIVWTKTTSRTSVAHGSFSLLDIAGDPPGGTLNAGNPSSGIVPVPDGVKYPIINPAIGTKYISKVEFASTVACRLTLFDKIFSCGAYPYNVYQTLTLQPSFAGRVPGGDYTNLEIWAEEVTTSTGYINVQVVYRDADNNIKTSPRTSSASEPTIGRCWPINAADGTFSLGVSKIDTVSSITATAGTFNINVLRRLWEGVVPATGLQGFVHDLMQTGMPQIYETSALYVLVTPFSTATGNPTVAIEIVDG